MKRVLNFLDRTLDHLTQHWIYLFSIVFSLSAMAFMFLEIKMFNSTAVAVQKAEAQVIDFSQVGKPDNPTYFMRGRWRASQVCAAGAPVDPTTPNPAAGDLAWHCDTPNNLTALNYASYGFTNANFNYTLKVNDLSVPTFKGHINNMLVTASDAVVTGWSVCAFDRRLMMERQ